MRDKGLGYDRAHEIASELEFDLRKGAGLTPLLTGGRRKVGKADLPGLTPDDIEISATADTFEISGELGSTADVPNEGWLRQERRSGKFARSFTVPMQIDPTKVEAKFTNGVLELVLPKADNVKPRQIKITATNTK